MKCKKTIRFLSFMLAGMLLIGSPLQASAANADSDGSSFVEPLPVVNDNEPAQDSAQSGSVPDSLQSSETIPDPSSVPEEVPGDDEEQNGSLPKPSVSETEEERPVDNTTSDEEYLDTLETEVDALSNVSSIVLNTSELQLILGGDSEVLSAAALDDSNSEITDQISSFTWLCSNNDIIDLDAEGPIATIHAKKTGEAVITVKTGGAVASCKVKVIIPVTDITLSAVSLSMKKNQTKSLSASVVPEDTTENRSLTWSSSNSGVVTVDAVGRLQALAGGTAVITVKTANNLIKTCTVTVSDEIYKTGWQCIDKKWYYYNGEGDRQTGWQQVGGKYYYMNASGVMLTGWQMINGVWYYLNPNGDRANGWLKLNNRWYYLDADGKMQTGLVQVGKAVYYCNSSGEMQTGWKVIENKWHYFNGSGVMQTDWTKVDGKWYYLGKDGRMQIGWLRLNGIWYYLNRSGEMQTGWGRIDNKWYYFDKDGVMLTNWIKLGNTRYYLAENGAMQTGWLKLGNVQYYFQPGGAMQTGWLRYSNAWYYFDADGARQTGWKKIGNSWYYLAQNGVMQTGWLKLGDVWYYLDTGGAMRTGWQKISSKWYYFNNSGAMQTGWQPINGKWYYLNSDGSMKTGWMKIENSWRYFKGNGAMATSDLIIDGELNRFTSSGVWQGVVSEKTQIKGIDVSSYQGSINWSKVAKDNIDFAMLRIVRNSGSSIIKDSTFEANYTGARNAGIKVGVYRYSYATSRTKARAEADAVLEALNGRKLDYPIVLDVEDSSLLKNSDNARRSEIILAFKERIEAKGYKFALYANTIWLNKYLDMDMLKDVDIWVARYRSLDKGHGYTGKGNVTMWQYSDSGSVDGINGSVDLNISYKKY